MLNALETRLTNRFPIRLHSVTRDGLPDGCRASLSFGQLKPVEEPLLQARHRHVEGLLLLQADDPGEIKFLLTF